MNNYDPIAQSVARGIQQEKADRKAVNSWIFLISLFGAIAWVYVGFWLAAVIFVLGLVMILYARSKQPSRRR